MLDPANVVIAVQGEQHFSKLDTRRNSRSRCQAALADSMARDAALAAAARKSHFQVVWLYPGRPAGRTKRWRTAIESALAAALEHKKPQLHIG